MNLYNDGRHVAQNFLREEKRPKAKTEAEKMLQIRVKPLEKIEIPKRCICEPRENCWACSKHIPAWTPHLNDEEIHAFLPEYSQIVPKLDVAHTPPWLTRQ